MCWPGGIDDHHQMSSVRSALPGFAIAVGVLIAGFLVAFTVGRYPVGLGDLANVLASKVFGHRADVSPAIESVILQVRGPRVLAAVFIGAALAVAGTAFQGLFRNPLVSPDILGASSGAALGAVVGIYFSLGILAIQAVAFVGGLIAVWLLREAAWWWVVAVMAAILVDFVLASDSGRVLRTAAGRLGLRTGQPSR